MRPCSISAALVVLFCLPGAAQKPGPEQQLQAVASAREIALHYGGTLPNFICTEQVYRTNRTELSGQVGTASADRLTIQLSFSGQKEVYKLLANNGAKTARPLSSLDGIITGGEFGSLQLGIFDPAAAADFQWKQATNLRKHPASVYTYRIARAHSHYMVGQRQNNGRFLPVAAGYHGEVVLDNETARVLRLTATADDIPKDAGTVASSVQVDYDFIAVAGVKYLLPAHSESQMDGGERKIGNRVAYTGYRKFEVDSSIDFGKQ